VVNAIRLAEQSLAEHGSVFSLGDIVHNRLEMERLEGLGLHTIGHDELAGAGTILIRAHGEPPATYKAAAAAGVGIIDATCPVVAALQRTVAAAHARMTVVGGQVVILGKRGHAEVVGLTGQVEATAATPAVGGICAEPDNNSVSPERPGQVEGGAEVIVVESEADLDAVDFSRPVYLLSQTTQSLDLFGRVSAQVRERGGEVTVHDTICRAVANREGRIGKFAARHDVVVFVSGRKSSNGRLLFEACRAANPRSYMVEDGTELQPEWFDGARSVGVCGATSTPKWVMEQVAQCVGVCSH
jgi:4-hydroxy-3-methylbut-2-enyl diphosphate reductase